ncbi:uncharacterized protein CLUP02_11733 [Colletotrichum lupini]|uniref:Uncharacterized protein n=1 Tax=Colletotrichum lupini TaxID=145971 RepID=A0A9Q8SZ66_9PEZI|nr:uncharacterized protein CLUP02_11733 [Colletotrichum lupini]UQC86233.1 hypothetical protein CLUP02_11733 [Colletotrichum lupini]
MDLGRGQPHFSRQQHFRGSLAPENPSEAANPIVPCCPPRIVASLSYGEYLVWHFGKPATHEKQGVRLNSGCLCSSPSSLLLFFILSIFRYRLCSKEYRFVLDFAIFTTQSHPGKARWEVRVKQPARSPARSPHPNGTHTCLLHWDGYVLDLLDLQLSQRPVGTVSLFETRHLRRRMNKYEMEPLSSYAVPAGLEALKPFRAQKADSLIINSCRTVMIQNTHLVEIGPRALEQGDATRFKSIPNPETWDPRAFRGPCKMHRLGQIPGMRLSPPVDTKNDSIEVIKFNRAKSLSVTSLEARANWITITIVAVSSDPSLDHSKEPCMISRRLQDGFMPQVPSILPKDDEMVSCFGPGPFSRKV